eukprot:Opistho-2@34630
MKQLLGKKSDVLDVILMDVIWVGDFADHLEDLNPYNVSSVTEGMFQSMVRNDIVDGRLVALPWFSDVGLLFYRKDLLRKYGFHSPPRTWVELRDMSMTIMDGEGNPNLWGFIGHMAEHEGLTCNVMEWMYAWGGGNLIERDRTVTLQNPRAEAALQFFYDGLGKWIMPQSVNYRTDDAKATWKAGNGVFVRNWPLLSSEMTALGNTTFAWGASTLPAGPSGLSAGALGGWQMAVSKYSKHKAIAVEFAKFMVSESVQRARAVNDARMPTRTALYDETPVCSSLNICGVTLSHVARPSTVSAPNYLAMSRAIFKNVRSALAGEVTVSAMLVALKTDAEKVLGTYTAPIPETGSGSNNKDTIIGAVVACGGGSIIFIAVVAYMRRSKKRALATQQKRARNVIDYNDLSFEEVVGRGGFGEVSRGKFRGTTVAIKKVLKSTSDAPSRNDATRTMQLGRNVMSPAHCTAVAFDDHLATAPIDRNEHSATSSNTSRRMHASTLSRLASRLNFMRSSNNASDESEKMSRKLFMDEVDIMVSLRHPHIVMFIGCCEEPELCLVTEFMPRGSVLEILQKEDAKMPWTRRLGMVLDAARGIQYLHTNNPIVLHCDLKAANLLVGDNYIVKVADFGLTKIAKKGMRAKNGSHLYASPEALRGCEYTVESDVYSFGIVMWEVLTAKIPYSDKLCSHSIESVVHSIVESDIRPTIPRTPHTRYTAVMTQCWQKDPSKRPGIADVATQLDRMIEIARQDDDESSVLGSSLANMIRASLDADGRMSGPALVFDERDLAIVQSGGLSSRKSSAGSLIAGMSGRKQSNSQMPPGKIFACRMHSGKFTLEPLQIAAFIGGAFDGNTAPAAGGLSDREIRYESIVSVSSFHQLMAQMGHPNCVVLELRGCAPEAAGVEPATPGAIRAIAEHDSRCDVAATATPVDGASANTPSTPTLSRVPSSRRGSMTTAAAAAAAAAAQLSC